MLKVITIAANLPSENEVSPSIRPTHSFKELTEVQEIKSPSDTWSQN